MGSDVKVSIKKKSGGKMKVRRMVIEPMKNGATSTIEHEPDGDEGKGGIGWMPPKETKMIHPSMAHLKKHVAATMGGSFGSAPTAETPDTGGAPGSDTDED